MHGIHTNDTGYDLMAEVIFWSLTRRQASFVRLARSRAEPSTAWHFHRMGRSWRPAG